MRPHPKIRKAAKRGTTAFLIVVCMAWAASAWVALCWGKGSGASVAVDVGSVWVWPPEARGGGRLPHGWMVFTHPAGLNWGYGWRLAASRWVWRFPLWMIAALTGCLTVVIWGLDAAKARRALIGLCPMCSYDRTGLAPGAVCPECGTLPALSSA